MARALASSLEISQKSSMSLENDCLFGSMDLGRHPNACASIDLGGRLEPGRTWRLEVADEFEDTLYVIYVKTKP
jgi:hypothetical protein